MQSMYSSERSWFNSQTRVQFTLALLLLFLFSLSDRSFGIIKMKSTCQQLIITFVGNLPVNQIFQPKYTLRLTMLFCAMQTMFTQSSILF